MKDRFLFVFSGFKSSQNHVRITRITSITRFTKYGRSTRIARINRFTSITRFVRITKLTRIIRITRFSRITRVNRIKIFWPAEKGLCILPIFSFVQISSAWMVCKKIFLQFEDIVFFCFSFKWLGWFVKDRFLTDAREQRHITAKSTHTTVVVFIVTIQNKIYILMSSLFSHLSMS